MSTVAITTYDPVTGVALQHEINEWQYFLWQFASEVLKTDASKSPLFVEFVDHLKNITKELEEAVKTNPDISYGEMPSFVKAIEIFERTQGFYTFEEEIPTELKEVELKIQALYKIIQGDRLNPTNFILLDELIETQDKLKQGFEQEKEKARIAGLQIPAHVCEEQMGHHA